jgi:hypothetical protein
MGKKQYRVLVGLNYPPNDKRAEPGDVVDDIPPGSLGWLLDAGAVEEVKADASPEQKEEG